MRSRVARFEAVTVLSKVHYKSTPDRTTRPAVMDTERLKAVETARVVSLLGLKTRLFPTYRVFLMNYPIPTNPQEMIALRQQPLNEELVASAIAGVIQIARSRSQSLDELKAEVLADDNLLDLAQRRWLSEIVAEAWGNLP